MKSIFQFVVKPWKTVKRLRRDRVLRRLARTTPRRVVVGSANIAQAGWIPTDIDQLDLLKPGGWARYFPADSVDAILAEHVWEHLTEAQGLVAAQTCFQYLRPGGHLRVAVPDGLHPDPRYIAYVRPGGHGVGADDHKVLYTHANFASLFEAAGFQVRLLEYFDGHGQFQEQPWDPKDGKIHRSRRFDERNGGGQLNYTSLILDAVKPDRQAKAAA